MMGTGDARIFAMIDRVESTSPPGRAQLDQHGIGIGLARLLDGAADVLIADGLDRIVNADLHHAAGEHKYGCEEQQNGYEK